MAIVRPAGLSDDDSSDDDYGYFDKPKPRNVQFDLKNTLRIYESKLKESIVDGDINEFKIILNNDLNNDVNVKLDSGWTPLLHACFHGQEQIVKYLLDAGALPNLSAGAKYKDLINLCENGTIPKIFHEEYRELPCSSKIQATLNETDEEDEKTSDEDDN